jgi:hypothetical protein
MNMPTDYTVIFKLIDSPENGDVITVETSATISDAQDISELTSLSESLREPEFLTFMVG